MKIAWSAKVSQTFIDRVIWIQRTLAWPDEAVNWLMASMAWETGERFSASIKNGAGSGAVGLIQFMPRTAVSLGTTSELLSRMAAEDQLNYVYKYFKPYKGRIENLEDMYMAILWPAAVGKPNNHVLWSKESRPTTYLQNHGLDGNKDNIITKEEAVAKVREKLVKGLLPANVK